MIWPIVLVLVVGWMLGLVLDVSGAYMLLVFAGILTISNLLIHRKHTV